MTTELFRFVRFTACEPNAFDERRGKVILPPAGLPYRVLKEVALPTLEMMPSLAKSPAGSGSVHGGSLSGKQLRVESRELDALVSELWPRGRKLRQETVQAMLDKLGEPSPALIASAWDHYAVSVLEGGEGSLPNERRVRALDLATRYRSGDDLSTLDTTLEYPIVIASPDHHRALEPDAEVQPPADKNDYEIKRAKLSDDALAASQAHEELLAHYTDLVSYPTAQTIRTPTAPSERLAEYGMDSPPNLQLGDMEPMIDVESTEISEEGRRQLRATGLHGSVPHNLALRKLKEHAVFAYNTFLHLPKPPLEEPPVRPYCQTMCTVRLIGKAAFIKAEQTLDRYEPEEIAHIENVLPGQYKERKTRRLDRSEETFTTSRDQETTAERDTQSTSKNEMQIAAKDVFHKESSTEFGLKLSATNGAVTIDSSFNMGSTQSHDQTMESIRTVARSVTDRALERVVTRVSEERSSKTLSEFEETNTHGLDNRGNSSSFVGVYRWLTKVYKAALKNYGERVALECLVENPGLFLREHDSKNGAVEIKDLASDFSISEADKVTENNFRAPAGYYGTAVEEPPADIIYLSKSYADVDPANDRVSSAHNDLQVPEGYSAVEVQVTGDQHPPSPSVGNTNIMVGDQLVWYSGNIISGALGLKNGLEKTLGVARHAWTRGTTATITVKCVRNPSLLEAWKLATFIKLKAGYDRMVAEGAQNSSKDGSLLGDARNPAINLALIEQELKKAVISALTCGRPFFLNCDRAYHDSCSGCASSTSKVQMHRRDHDVCRVGTLASFLESAIDWELMIYQLYPYYWSNPCDWPENIAFHDDDPLFERFLRSGMARVVLPVNPGMLEAFMHFYKFGTVWNGITSPPILGGYEELNIAVDVLDGTTGLPITWEIPVPTSLTILQCGSGCVDTHDKNGFPLMPIIVGAGPSSELKGKAIAPTAKTQDEEASDHDHSHG